MAAKYFDPPSVVNNSLLLPCDSEKDQREREVEEDDLVCVLRCFYFPMCLTPCTPLPGKKRSRNSTEKKVRTP